MDTDLHGHHCHFIISQEEDPPTGTNLSAVWKIYCRQGWAAELPQCDISGLMKPSTGTENAKLLPYYMNGLICLSVAMQFLLQKKKKDCSCSQRDFHLFYAYFKKGNCKKF